MANHITDIHCPTCGAAAEFDIRRQEYLCGYCGGKVRIGEAIREKQGFRAARSARLKQQVKNYKMFSASCSRCGANVIFEENEALSTCPFCGQSLVRKEYLHSDSLPELVIPFRLTQEEAGQRLEDWCRKNPRKREARKLLPQIGKIKGFYLPYELVRGPVHIKASRMDGGSLYRCEGFLDGEFINCSSQLDNLLLDGMEPFDTADLSEFDFAYVAGQRVKIPDTDEKTLLSRRDREAETLYTPAVRKTFQTKAVSVKADTSSAVRLPVLLPVYYISEGELQAAVNGQTGKVSVRAEKDSHFFFLPWWVKAILATLAFCGAFLGAVFLSGAEMGAALLIAGALAVFYFIVTLCLYSDTTKNRLFVVSGRQIYSSGEQNFKRESGFLVPSESVVRRKTAVPVFFSRVDGKDQPVTLKFATPARVLRMYLLAFIALFLPVIIALFLNGFDIRGIHLEGSAVWFCIMVPVVPIYLLKFGIVELYKHPWVYITDDDGRQRRFRKKPDPKTIRSALSSVLMAMFIPPVSLAVWFGIISFCVICYLTAFG